MSQPLPDDRGRPAYLRLVDDPRPTSATELIELAQAEERQGRRTEARQLFERALSQLERPAQGALASSVLRWIARTLQTDGRLDTALDRCDDALAAAREAGDEPSVGLALNQRASILVSQGRLDEAEQLYEDVRTRALMLGDSKLAAMTAQNLGVIANIRGDLARALRQYEASLADYRALGLPKDVCVALNNLGMLQMQMQRWEAAERSYEEALQIGTALGDHSARMLIQANLADLWLRRGSYDRARAACDVAMELSRQTGDTHVHGDTFKIYGVIERETGDAVHADEHFARASEIAAERQDLLLQAEVARERAELYRRQGRNREMLICLNQAHRLFSQLRARRGLADVDRQHAQLEAQFLDVVKKWSSSIESKDRYTQGHCERVADIASALAAATGMDERSLFWFRIGALLHDVGKLIIPAEILNKPARLTPEEWELVKRHPGAGVEMLADIDFPWDVRPIVESHHERWDGQGYPHGLAGEAIPFTARILCIADVYEALTSERSYKPAWSHERAMEVMAGDAGTQFDPELFRLFEQVMRHGPPAPRALPAGPAPLRGEGADMQRDDLTGVALRRPFVENLTARLARRESDVPLALLVIDIDHFKLVNDTYGHLQGDDVLRAVAAMLVDHVPVDATVGRYAGDEFVVLLPGHGAEQALAVAEALRAEAARMACALRGHEGGVVSITLSIGAASAPQHGVTFETLFAAADGALYDAKRRGRDTVGVAGGEAAGAAPRVHLEQFVGRGDELRRLVRLLEGACRGQPQVVTVSGEAGIGKTTVTRQLAPEVRLRGGAVASGRSLEGDVKPPYGPWADVIGALRNTSGVSARVWPELSNLVPSLGAGASDGARSGGNRYALFAEMAEFLRTVAETHPVVIVLDDMQWADGASWDVLEFLVPQLTSERILICLTIRAEDALGDVIERRRRLSRDERFHGITLPRLSSDDLQEWTAAIFHSDELATTLAPFLYQRTEGNPLLVVQVLRTLLEDGAISSDGGTWRWQPVPELRLPVAVSDLMARRLERLTIESRTLLTAAAVVGRTFDVDLVIEAGAGSEDDVLAAIDDGLAASVLQPAPGGNADHFAFTHALLGETLLKAANPRRLRRTHERVAIALERLRPDAIDEIAAHYAASGNSEPAFRYLVMAGARATSLYANEEAAQLFGLALGHAATPAERADVRRKLAAVLEAAGRYAEAERLCDELLSEQDDDAVRRLALRRQRERLRALQDEPPRETLEVCRALLGEAEALAAESECVALLMMMSVAYGRIGDAVSAEQLAGECVTRAGKMGDDRLLAEALARLATTLLDRDASEARALYARAQELFVALDDRRGQARCQMNTGIALSRAGAPDEAERAVERALELGRSAHAPDIAGLASLNLGVMAMKSGRFGVARARFGEALRLFAQMQSAPHRLATVYNTAHLARETGDVPTARTAYAEAAVLARGLGHTEVELGAIAGGGLAALAAADQDGARRAHDAVEPLLAGRTEWWFQGRELVEALEVALAIAQGETDRATHTFTRALGRAERHDPYAAAWLVAECARALKGAGSGDVRDAIARHAANASALGFLPIAERLASLSVPETTTS